MTRTRRRIGESLISDDGLTRLLSRAPSWLVDKVPRDHRESDAAFRRRRRVTAAVSVAGAGLLGVSLSRKPDSASFYALTLWVAGTWVAGGLASGPLHLGWVQTPRATLRRPLLTPLVGGAGAFGLFYAAALVATRNPALVLASVPMGLLFAFQRRVTGGIQAPALTHLTWSVLMLRYLPPLFADKPSIDVEQPAEP
jgi:uncharacterized protein